MNDTWHSVDTPQLRRYWTPWGRWLDDRRRRRLHGRNPKLSFMREDEKPEGFSSYASSGPTTFMGGQDVLKIPAPSRSQQRATYESVLGPAELPPESEGE